MRACLEKLGLNVSQEHATIPSLSPLHLSSTTPASITTLLKYLGDLITIEGGQLTIREENDTFVLYSSSNAPPTSNYETQEITKGPPDYNQQIKSLVSYSDSYPSIASTPYFDHHAFYAHLKQYQSQTPTAKSYGQYLLYGERVTSTTTLLEKLASLFLWGALLIKSRNPRLLRLLPSGLVAVASQQLLGRGRGSNTWLSPSGSLAFSALVRHHMDSASHDPVGFGQYLAAIAVVEGIKTYGPEYANIEIRIKWPNDICMSLTLHQTFSLLADTRAP